MAELKRPTTCHEQVNLLKSRNVIVGDTEACVAILESVSYYRLTAYLLPFKQDDGCYRRGTKFETAYRIYEFDRKLRGVLFAALEEVEVYPEQSLLIFMHINMAPKDIWNLRIFQTSIMRKSSVRT